MKTSWMSVKVRRYVLRALTPTYSKQLFPRCEELILFVETNLDRDCSCKPDRLADALLPVTKFPKLK